MKSYKEVFDFMSVVTALSLSKAELNKLISRLGIDNDSKISRDFKVTLNSVYRLRKSLGISVSPTFRLKESNFNEACFDTMNHTGAYWLGVLFSDGNICETTKKRRTINLSMKDKDTIYKYASFIGYKKKPIKRTFSGNYSPVYTVSVSNNRLFYKLSEYGMIPNKTKILLPPNINKELNFSFLCGYFDGDGSISLNRKINSWKVSFGFASFEFYKWFNGILDNESISYTTEEKRTRAGNRFYTSTMVGISGKYFLSLCYENVPEKISMDRKRKKYNKMSPLSLSPPRYKDWEKKILMENDIDTALELIKIDKRNYGWIRNKEYAGKILKNILK